MDVARFEAALPTAFTGEVTDGLPVDPRFAALVDQVGGFTPPATLAVLNTAARLLPADECYLEVGTFKGRSLCAALLDAQDREFVAVENFQEFGMVGAEARTVLADNVRGRAEGRRLRLVEGDCFAVLAREGAVPQPVGVYFYDGAHTRLAHRLALSVVEPLLADEALVLVDDASWRLVRSATLRYVTGHAEWGVVTEFRVATPDDPRWANGLLVLRYRRAPASRGRRRTRSFSEEWRRQLQVRLRGPATMMVWRTLHQLPWLVPVARRLVPKRSRRVDSSEQGSGAGGRDLGG
ncbi:MAG: class I SAM-dependent methyltransferase [Sporichthyaceae bacterium]